MIKIVFFDIDGTLLSTKKELPNSTIQAVKQLQENGVITAIASGRTTHNIQFILDALNIDTYVVFNGGLVVYKNEVVHQNSIDPKVIETFSNMVIKNNHGMIQNGIDHFSIISSNPKAIRQQFLSGNWDLLRLKTGMLEEPVSQIELFCTEEEAKLYFEFFTELTFYPWVSRLNAFNAIPSNVSKASGIQRVLDAMGISKEEAVAFGDGPNDIEMLSYVGTGVAMGNAVEELKRVATMVTDHVNQDGIEAALKKLVLI